VWLLTEKLHSESRNNPMWRRFLLNQELFEKNVQEGTGKFSASLNMLEMQQMLNKVQVGGEFDNEY
jgi:hypothetical protein